MTFRPPTPNEVLATLRTVSEDFKSRNPQFFTKTAINSPKASPKPKDTAKGQIAPPKPSSQRSALLRGALKDAIPEYRFEPTRKWRFDYAWPAVKLALEIEGGVWTHGRHTRGSGFVKDMEKYNHAACLGWRILRVQPGELNTVQTEQMIITAMAK